MTGRPIGFLYRGFYRMGFPPTASLTSDGSGRYLLINEGRGTLVGWVHAGQLHLTGRGEVDWQAGAW